jgi:hypothetical protein
MAGLGTVEMWGAYVFQGHEVMVIQQWVDPFGRRMVRIQTTGPGPEQATGLLEAEFLDAAVEVREAGAATPPEITATATTESIQNRGGR